MSKNSVIATLIALFVIVVPFRLAFLNADIHNPLLTGSMFLLTIGGTFLSLSFALKTAK
ncbi:MAG: hypothetical protein ACO3EE_01335 [Flavobacteriales bacterium]